jgi:hypothetical protein
MSAPFPRGGPPLGPTSHTPYLLLPHTSRVPLQRARLTRRVGEGWETPELVASQQRSEGELEASVEVSLSQYLQARYIHKENKLISSTRTKDAISHSTAGE